MSIAENIKRLREAYGLTQEELGDIAGVSGKAVSKWESGAGNPRMGAVQRIADHFHISKSTIIDEYNQVDERQKMLERAYSDNPDKRTLYSMVDRANEEQTKWAIKALAGILGEKEPE